MNYTPIRPPKSSTAVYNALQQLSHATANEIMDWSNRHTTGKPVSLTSVYRALNYLVAEKKVKPLNFNDGQVRYELNSNKMHHHHLVCTTCNQVEMIDTCPFETFLKTLHSQFKVEYHNFEVFGVCGNCYNTPQSTPGEEFPSSDYTIFKRDHVIG
jgi:Fe2+ or Zn2+ uptake regulation protein